MPTVDSVCVAYDRVGHGCGCGCGCSVCARPWCVCASHDRRTLGLQLQPEMEMELNLKLEHADSSRHWSHSLDTEEDQGESRGARGKGAMQGRLTRAWWLLCGQRSAGSVRRELLMKSLTMGNLIVLSTSRRHPRTRPEPPAIKTGSEARRLWTTDPREPRLSHRYRYKCRLVVAFIWQSITGSRSSSRGIMLVAPGNMNMLEPLHWSVKVRIKVGEAHDVPLTS